MSVNGGDGAAAAVADTSLSLVNVLAARNIASAGEGG